MPDTGKLVFLFLARLHGLLLIFHLAVCLVSKWKISNVSLAGKNGYFVAHSFLTSPDRRCQERARPHRPQRFAVLPSSHAKQLEASTAKFPPFGRGSGSVRYEEGIRLVGTG
jgi:hypothetical protein